jgi:hypothetical protein
MTAKSWPATASSLCDVGNADGVHLDGISIRA